MKNTFVLSFQNRLDSSGMASSFVVFVVSVVFVVVVFAKVDLLAILADSETVRDDEGIDRSLLIILINFVESA